MNQGHSDLFRRHAEALEAIGKQLARDFDTPAQRIINRGFEAMRIQRFSASGDDLWEMYIARKNGWEYTKPPRHLAERWASY